MPACDVGETTGDEVFSALTILAIQRMKAMRFMLVIVIGFEACFESGFGVL